MQMGVTALGLAFSVQAHKVTMKQEDCSYLDKHCLATVVLGVIGVREPDISGWRPSTHPWNQYRVANVDIIIFSGKAFWKLHDSI